MLKQIRRMAATLLVVAGACAPPAQEVPGPAPRPGEQPRPEQPEQPRREDPLRIGVILSSSGSSVLKQYSDLVLAGARVAEEAGSTAARDVELVVRDDAGTPSGAGQAVQELEQAGVDVIVGPLVDQALLAAAQARRDNDLVIISPTAVSQPIGIRNAYALNVVDTRGSEALGEYARRWSRVGVLHSTTPESQRQAEAFMAAYRSGGGVLINMPFGSTATNVVNELTVLRDSLVEAIYFPASERELQIVLPQMEYSLAGVQLLGNESWAGDAARRLPQRVLEGAIIATPLDQSSDAVAWEEFVQQYESLHRRSLSNPVPALGFDAARLALHALTTGNTTVTDFRGATGVITLRDGHVTRRPFLLRIESGRLVPIN
ncbi:MAG TPA: penicillin-binding protein activator [Longimicrobiales bacterium]